MGFNDFPRLNLKEASFLGGCGGSGVYTTNLCQEGNSIANLDGTLCITGEVTTSYAEDHINAFNGASCEAVSVNLGVESNSYK